MDDDELLKMNREKMERAKQMFKDPEHAQEIYESGYDPNVPSNSNNSSKPKNPAILMWIIALVILGCTVFTLFPYNLIPILFSLIIFVIGANRYVELKEASKNIKELKRSSKILWIVSVILLVADLVATLILDISSSSGEPSTNRAWHGFQFMMIVVPIAIAVILIAVILMITAIRLKNKSKKLCKL